MKHHHPSHLILIHHVGRKFLNTALFSLFFMPCCQWKLNKSAAITSNHTLDLRSGVQPNKYTKMLPHGRRRRYNSPTASMMLSILCIFVLAQQISSFQLISFRGGFNSYNREILSTRRSTAADSEVEEAVSLGRAEFEKYFEFPLDDWQLQAGGSILKGHNVIVCAPTGSGKTVVGEMALHSAFDRDFEGVYTTPLKALSNQKFSELRQIFGNSNVGLSTGDISINRDAARLTVMTTEVYRNIAWRSSGQESNVDKNKSNDLGKNSVVVLDEFHYMGQPGRGGKAMKSLLSRFVSCLSSYTENQFCCSNKKPFDNYRSLGRVCHYITYSYTNSWTLSNISKR